eukprot:121586_1
MIIISIMLWALNAKYLIYNDKNSQLRSIDIQFDSYATMVQSYFEPILNLLNNIPPSVMEIKLKLPDYIRWESNSDKQYNKLIKEKECKKLVNKLCEMSYNKTKESKLE